MISGAHVLLYSKDPEADRAFLKTVLEFPSIDLGEGWLLFALPPAELAVHLGDGDFVQMHAEHPRLGAVLYLMCDDLRSAMQAVESKGVTCATPVEVDWGRARAFACRAEVRSVSISQLILRWLERMRPRRGEFLVPSFRSSFTFALQKWTKKMN